MALYEILTETSTPEIVAVVNADSPKQAKERAKLLGYGKGYIVEQVQEAYYDH